MTMPAPFVEYADIDCVKREPLFATFAANGGDEGDEGDEPYSFSSDAKNCYSNMRAIDSASLTAGRFVSDQIRDFRKAGSFHEFVSKIKARVAVTSALAFAKKKNRSTPSEACVDFTQDWLCRLSAIGLRPNKVSASVEGSLIAFFMLADKTKLVIEFDEDLDAVWVLSDLSSKTVIATGKMDVDDVKQSGLATTLSKFSCMQQQVGLTEQ